MTGSRLLIVLAVSFAVAGDYYLKLYGDTGRQLKHVLLCLGLWEGCALAWVVVYLRHSPRLGQSTAFAAAVTLASNCLLGWFVFGERFNGQQCVGLAFAFVAMALLA